MVPQTKIIQGWTSWTFFCKVSLDMFPWTGIELPSVVDFLLSHEVTWRIPVDIGTVLSHYSHTYSLLIYTMAYLSGWETYFTWIHTPQFPYGCYIGQNSVQSILWYPLINYLLIRPLNFFLIFKTAIIYTHMVRLHMWIVHCCRSMWYM